MSHKDAPPETESQKACREWWEKARPTVKRAWGRAQDGSFLAEETRLIHQSWEAASQQANAEVERLRAEIGALRAIAGCAYQMAGVHDAPEVWLDRLSEAANGDPLPDPDTIIAELLPYMPQAVCEAEVRALELEREIEALRAEVSSLRAARIAYANEFPTTEDGDPDTGNIHANIRALKARAERLEAEVERLRADRDSWEQQASDRVADWHAEHLRAERLEAEVAEWKRVAAAQAELHDEAEARAELLAEALRELVDVFRESGMYDDEVFAKALEALEQEDKA